jgi:predicted TPR repeat methyltransferase
VKLQDYDGATASLRRALALDPASQASFAGTLPAARHMARALVADSAAAATGMEPAYIQQLFGGYAETYDAHAKKLLYSAPR